MKKILLLSTIAFSCFAFAQEQVIVSQNFNSLTNGNIATDITGNTAGQAGWYIYGGTGTTAANFQIVNVDVPHGKSAQITSGASYSATNNPNNRFLFYDTSTVIATVTNNIYYGQFDIYTGPATGAGSIGATSYDSTGNPIVGINYDYATKKISGAGRLTKISDGSSAYYNITLGTQTFPANSWVTVAFTYNVTTGALNYAYTDGTSTNSFSGGFPTPPAGYTLETGFIPSEFDFVSQTKTGNTIANVASVDNLSLKFSNAALMGVNDIQNATVGAELISVFPNPTTEILNIKTKDRVKSVAVYDMSGKKVEVKLNGNSIDVKNLENGAYMISIETNKEIQSLKFIKK